MSASEPQPERPALSSSTSARRAKGETGAGFGVQVLLMAAIFGSATTVTMLGPLLVDLSRDLDVSLGQAGLLAAALAVTWALSAPFAGVLSDRFGRRPLIVLALVGLGTVTLGAGLAPSFGVLLVMRALAGIFGGFGPAVVIAAAGDLFPPSRRGMAMGWANLGFSMSAIVGVPSIGAIGGTIGWRWAFAATGLLVISLGVLIQRTFPKLRVVRAESDDATSYLAALRVPGLWSILAANVFERALFTQVPGLAISVAGGTIFTLVNASSRPALLALSAELSTRYRGAIMGVFSVTNQAGVVLGASVGGLAIGVGGYSALALTMAVDAVLASSLALPLLRRRPAG